MKHANLFYIITSIILVVAILYLFLQKPQTPYGNIDIQSQNVELKDNIQYVTIKAGGGYSPHTSIIQSNIPTKLIIKTNGTYDCSASLVIRSAGVKKILQPTGEEVIDLGILRPGEKIQGVCGMGMYNFVVSTN